MTHPLATRSPFTATLRARKEAIRLGAPGAPTIALRVEANEVWDVVRIDVPADEPLMSVKLAALEALLPQVRYPDEYVMKLHGVEVLDEQASVAATGARDGSIFLLTSRRRRPVR